MKNKNYIIASVIIIIFTTSAFFLGSYTSKNKGIEMRKTGQFGIPDNGNMPRFDRTGSGSPSNGRMIQGKLVNGEVLSNDGTVMSVKLDNGGSKIIITSQNTKFNKIIEANIKDVSIGKSVMVTGESNPDGSMTANNIQIR